MKMLIKHHATYDMTLCAEALSCIVRILAKLTGDSENQRSRSARMAGHARPEYAPQ